LIIELKSAGNCSDISNRGVGALTTSPSLPEGSEARFELTATSETAAGEHCSGICCVTDREDGALTVLASSSVGSMLSK